MKLKFAVVAAGALPLLQLANALVIPHSADLLNIFGGLDRVENVQDLGALAAKEETIAPLLVSDSAASKVVDDSYIIVFKDDISETVAHEHSLWINELHEEHISALKKRNVQHSLLADSDHGLKHVFNIGSGLKGYSGKFFPETVEAIRKHPAVKFVEKDSKVSIDSFDIQNDAPWGLARISHRQPLSLGTFNKYLFDDEGGEGVTSYVIDTGTNIEHVDLEGRASWGKTIPQGDADVDGNGHGSHCSGTIGGAKYGVAKNVKIVAVKVLRSDGSGSMSDVIKGIEFAAEAHIKETKSNKKLKGSTANMSLGGGKSPSLDIAVNAAVQSGIHFAVAAGNDNADACRYSPAAADLAVTVGASSLSDDRAYFSNYGTCVDIFAPGVNIQSIYTGSKYAVATLSGTSMASPHVAGLLSYFVSLQPTTDSEFATYGAVTPKQLKKNLIAYGTEGKLNDIDEETPNILVFNGAGHNLTSFWSNGRSGKALEQEDGSVEEKVNILPIDVRIQDKVHEIVADLEEVFDEMLDFDFE